MKIVKEKIRPVLEKAYCDVKDCGGEMKLVGGRPEQDNVVLLGQPKKPPVMVYLYKCDRCGKEESAKEQYPRIKYEF